MKKQISNKYDKMTPQERREIAANFHELSDEAMSVIGRVADILIKNYAAPKQEDRKLPRTS